MALEKKIKYDANYVNYLLNLFEGRISVTEILQLPLSFLNELQKHKEKELEERAKEINKIKNSNNQPQQMTINSSGKRYVDKTTQKS